MTPASAIVLQMMWDSTWAVRIRIPSEFRPMPHELVLRTFEADRSIDEQSLRRITGGRWAYVDVLVSELKDGGQLRYVCWLALLSEQGGQPVLEAGAPPLTIPIASRSFESQGQTFPDAQARWVGPELPLGDFAARVDSDSRRSQFVLVRR